MPHFNRYYPLFFILHWKKRFIWKWFLMFPGKVNSTWTAFCQNVKKFTAPCGQEAASKFLQYIDQLLTNYSSYDETAIVKIFKAYLKAGYENVRECFFLEICRLSGSTLWLSGSTLVMMSHSIQCLQEPQVRWVQAKWNEQSVANWALLWRYLMLDFFYINNVAEK